MTFAELGLAPGLVAALAKQGITVPTAIQQLALPSLQAGGDAYLNAETGTGKTLAYLLPIFGRLDATQPATQAIIVAPTHELAIQIHRQCCDLAQNAGRPVRSLLLIGGTSMERQLDKLKSKPHVVVGSPGRIRELMSMGKLKPKAVRTFVVDEADPLLGAEGLPDIRAILQGLPPDRQLVFVSATEKPETAGAVATLAPGRVMLRPGTAAVPADITHLYLVCEERDKPRVLRQLLHAVRPELALVFAHLNETAERVAAQLAHHQVPVAELHARLDKRRRQQSMDDFRAGRARVMVASDVAAHGLDIPGVTHVFNLDVPSQSKAYLHRVGRTGRAGERGVAISLMTGDEVRLARRYERELGIVLQRVGLREGRLVVVEDEPRRR
jgi:ATP-dependent RNA helicase DeaD